MPPLAVSIIVMECGREPWRDPLSISLVELETAKFSFVFSMASGSVCALAVNNSASI